MQESDRLFAELEPLLAAAGLTLVELSAKRRGTSASVRMTVYASAGTGTKECAAAHRIAFPRLVAAFGTEDVSLEVASPGIDRALKAPRDWALFAGKAARVLLEGESEWISGRIVRSDSASAVLSCAGKERVIEFASIAKAKLDSTGEGD